MARLQQTDEVPGGNRLRKNGETRAHLFGPMGIGTAGDRKPQPQRRLDSALVEQVMIAAVVPLDRREPRQRD